MYDLELVKYFKDEVEYFWARYDTTRYADTLDVRSKVDELDK